MFIPGKVVLVIDILDDDGGDDIMVMIRVMAMMMILMVSPCKVVLVVDIFDDEVCVHSSLFLLPDDLVATSFENGFLLFFFFISLRFSTKGHAFIISYLVL